MYYSGGRDAESGQVSPRPPRFGPHREVQCTISVLTLSVVHYPVNTTGEPYLYAFSFVSFASLDSQFVLESWLLGATDRANMMGIDTLGDLLCLTQVILGGGAKTNRTSLEQVIPRREILYVGGRYTNITASLIPCYPKCL